MPSWGDAAYQSGRTIFIKEIMSKPPKLDAFTEDQHEVPAIFSNHIGFNVYPDGVRITFNESPNGTNEAAQPRVAVYVHKKTAEALMGMLMKALQQPTTKAN